METNRGSQGILSEALNDKREAIVELLKTAYFMELETVMNYVTNSINPDGVRAQEVKENIEADIQEELAHAQQFAQRIKELYGTVPGSMDFRAVQEKLQPPEDQIDVVHVIKGVIDAEDGAIEHYTRIIQETEEVDPVTNDMVIAVLRDEEGAGRDPGARDGREAGAAPPVPNDRGSAVLRDEQGHRRLFEGFLREYEFEGRT